MTSIDSMSAFTPNAIKEMSSFKAKNTPSTNPIELPQDTVSFKGNVVTSIAKPATKTKFIATILGFMGLGLLAYKAHRNRLEEQNNALIKEKNTLINEKNNLATQVEQQNDTINELNQKVKNLEENLLKALGVSDIDKQEETLAFTFKNTPFVMDTSKIKEPYVELVKIIQNKEVPEGVTIYNPKATNLPPVDTARIFYCYSVYNEPIKITSTTTRSDLEDRDWNDMYGDKYSIKYEYEYNGKCYQNSILRSRDYSRKDLMNLIIIPDIEYKIKQDAIKNSAGKFAELIK